MSNTEITEYKFTVKEGSPSINDANDAPVWLALEPMQKELSIVKSGFLSFCLAEGSTVQQATEIASYLNENIKGVGYTR